MKIQKNSLLFLVLLALLPLTFMQAQPAKKATAATAETSDPKAKVLLDKLRKQFEAYKSIEVNFMLTIEPAERPKEVQKGRLIQQGTMFALEMDKQSVYCDGKNTWFHLKKENEVQLSTYDGSMASGILSPRDLIKMYQNGDYIYSITGSGTEAGKNVQFIEFKPVKRNNEYSKMRLAVDAKTNQFVSLKVFAKDGSKYTMNISALVPNKTYIAQTFTFNKAKFPGVRVEDLRED